MARLALLMVSALAVAMAGLPPAGAAGALEIRFLDAGHGDAALYVGPCGEVGVIDVLRGGADEVLAALDDIGSRELAWISVSHYDADHVGGVVDLATAGVAVAAVYDRGGDRTVKNTDTYRRYYDWATTQTTRIAVDIGDRFTLCSGDERVLFSVVSAGTDGTAADDLAVTEENDRGLCIHVEYGSFDLATCGDVNGTDDGSRSDVESAVAAHFGDVEVVKVNHHGSPYSSNADYIASLAAEAAVVMAGRNGYGHPDAGVLQRWRSSGAEVFVTRQGSGAVLDGDVVVTTDGTSFLVRGMASGRTLTAATDVQDAAVPSSPFDGDPSTTERLGAPDARTQAVEISRERFAEGAAAHVVLSRDDVFADSLAGTPLLGDGPMLLTASTGLPSSTLAELQRVLPAGGRVYLLGGEQAIAPLVEGHLRSLGYDTVRLGGATRVETSIAIAREVLALNPSITQLVLARADAPSGNPTAAWADSVTGGAWAAWSGSPVVLTQTQVLHPAAAALLTQVAPRRTVLLGGTAALSAAIEHAVPAPHRVSGANRAATAAAIARDLWPSGSSRFVVINGYQADGWAYGLPAAGLSADAQAPLLVSQAVHVPPETLQLLTSPCGSAPQLDVLLAGGPVQLSADVAAQLERVDGGPCDDDALPANCDPAYPDFCIPPPPPDLNCADIPESNFTVLPPDPHNLDGNKDGVGCEA